LYITIIKTVQ